jgi:L-threonylcarbamoyladenylate synthase
MPLGDFEILSVDPAFPEPKIIEKAAGVINQGGIVVFPTSTFYGIGARAFDVHAVDRVFRIKERHRQNPLLVLIASLTDLDCLVRSIPSSAARLMDTLWPGGVTLVFDAAAGVPSNLTGHSGKIGIRLAGHPVAAALARAVTGPVTATSANLSGEESCAAVASLNRGIKDHVDLVLDAGRLPGKRGSTVVDVTVFPPKILREGVISAKRIRGILAS